MTLQYQDKYKHSTDEKGETKAFIPYKNDDAPISIILTPDGFITRISASYDSDSPSLEILEPAIKRILEQQTQTPGLSTHDIIQNVLNANSILTPVAEQKYKELQANGTPFAALDDLEREAIISGIIREYTNTAGGEIIGAIKSAPIRAKKIKYATSKLTREIFNAPPNPFENQIIVGIDTAPAEEKMKNVQWLTFAAMDFSNTPLSITKQLTIFDKFVFQFAVSLYKAGNKVITARQIYFAMGNESEPNSEQIANIIASVEKMMSILITIDNTHEAAHSNYKLFDKGITQFLRVDVVKGTLRGGKTDALIYFIGEPFLSRYSSERGETEDIPAIVFQSGIRKTEKNMRIEDCLIDAISSMKRGEKNTKTKYKRNAKIKYDPFFEKANITDPADKSHKKKTMERYLKHYTKCNFIKGYTIQPDGIIIDYKRKKETPDSVDDPRPIDN